MCMAHSPRVCVKTRSPPAPKARNVIAQGNALGWVLLILEALKARNRNGSIKTVVIVLRPTHFALSALAVFNCSYLGRWPRLLHFAPVALSGLSFDTGSESVG